MDQEHGTETAVMLSRKALNGIIANWATDQGLIDPHEPFTIQWFYNRRGDAIGLRIDVPEDPTLIEEDESPEPPDLPPGIN